MGCGTMKEKRYGNEIKFFIGCVIIIVLFAIFCVLPIILVFSASITDENALIAEGYSFWPSTISFSAYKYLWTQRAMIGRSYLVSIFVTVFGTSIGVLVCTMLAYPLSRKSFRFANLFTFIVFFTMLFNGGTVSSYMVWTRIFHIKNTIYALIFPNLMMNAFNVILIKNYFANSIPDSLIEAAKLDGAKESHIFTKIMIPLSKPAIVTVAMFSGIAYWNDWTNGLYYINNTKLYSIQLLLNEIQQNISMLKTANDTFGTVVLDMDLPSSGVRMAIAVVALLPILIIFPLIQKQLIKGIVIGAVKG